MPLSVYVTPFQSKLSQAESLNTEFIIWQYSQLPSSTLAVGSKLNAVASVHPGISSCDDEDENEIFVSIQGLPEASCPSKFI